jgi:hypothetical protein
VTVGEAIAPSGAGLADGGIGAAGGVAGAVLPGEAPGALETTGALVAPVGAGEADCAQATPAETIKAAEASMSERMEISLLRIKFTIKPRLSATLETGF